MRRPAAEDTSCSARRSNIAAHPVLSPRYCRSTSVVPDPHSIRPRLHLASRGVHGGQCTAQRMFTGRPASGSFSFPRRRESRSTCAAPPRLSGSHPFASDFDLRISAAGCQLETAYCRLVPEAPVRSRAPGPQARRMPLRTSHRTSRGSGGGYCTPSVDRAGRSAGKDCRG